MEILATVLLTIVLIFFALIGVVLLIVVMLVKSYGKVLSAMLGAGLAWLMFGDPKKKSTTTYRKYDRGV